MSLIAIAEQYVASEVRFLYDASGYIGGDASFQDVINKATSELFCAATPNPDASQVQCTCTYLEQVVTQKFFSSCESQAISQSEWPKQRRYLNVSQSTQMKVQMMRCGVAETF